MNLGEAKKTNGHAEPVTRVTDAGLARIERRIAEIEASGEQRVNALRDAVGEFIDDELAPRDEQIAIQNEEIASLKQCVADLEHKFEQKMAVDQQVHEIATRLEERQAQRDKGKNGITHGDFTQTTNMMIAQERQSAREEFKAANEGSQRGVEAKLAALEQRIVQQTDQRIVQHIEQCSGRAETLGKAIETERTERHKEVKAAVEEAQRAVEAKLDAKLAAQEQRIVHQIKQCSGQADALGEAIAAERTDRREESEAAVDEAQRAVETRLEAKLTALEARFKALVPDKLPIAKIYCPDTVHYGGEVVVHRGATFQALRDTACAPPHVDDWVCLASAGRDAVTPTIRGTYNVHEDYKMLNIVALDGGSFIAKCDSPGPCPGDDWQLLCKQGKTGHAGVVGPMGPRGEKGERGEDGLTTVSWQLDRANYRMSPLMNNGMVGPMQEFRGMFEQFVFDYNSVFRD